MRQYIKTILPNTTVALLCCVLPILSAIYFTFTRYSERFAAEQDLTYLDVQGGWLGRAVLDQAWLEWLNRFMDFAFWGLLGALILVGIWTVSSAKTAFKNHYAQEEFNNFNESTSTWHKHFFTVLVVRTLLVFAVIFVVVSIIGKYIPKLSADIINALSQATFQTLGAVLLTCLIMFLYQYIAVVAIKVFRITRAG